MESQKEIMEQKEIMDLVRKTLETAKNMNEIKAVLKENGFDENSVYAGFCLGCLLNQCLPELKRVGEINTVYADYPIMRQNESKGKED